MTCGPIFSLWAFRGSAKVSRRFIERATQLTGLLKKSLLVYAAVPATNLPAFSLRAATPLIVNGLGSTVASVSLTVSISIAEGGAIFV